MPKYASVVEHLSAEELKQLYMKASDSVESRRYHLIWLVQRGRTLKQAAEVVGLNYDYAKDLLALYNRQGPDGLRNGRRRQYRRGRASLLNEEQLLHLQQRLQTPPEDGGLWSGPKVAAWIEQLTGREKVWPQRGWEYLKRCGYSLQRPRPRHAKAEAIAQAEFKKTT